MRREDLEHLIRAAGAISGSRRIVVVGSQAILGQFPEGAPARATLSMEADLLPIDAPDKADLLTGTLGELSTFHDTFGYFGDGVSLETAILPEGWKERLIPIENPNTAGYVGLGLEVHSVDRQVRGWPGQGSRFLHRDRRRRPCRNGRAAAQVAKHRPAIGLA